VCYVVPGRDLRPGTSHTRQVLTLAGALARDATVTVVFRRLLGDVRRERFTVSALEPGAGAHEVFQSRRSLGRFVERQATAFGVVLEGSWPMSGKLTAWCGQRGVPAIPVVDRLLPTSWLGSRDAGPTWLGLGASGRYLRRAQVIVAGSPELRDAIVERWRVPSERIAVIGPAIDRTLFAPRDQGEARRRLGFPSDHRIVLAGDGLGEGADLAPLIEAVERSGDPSLRLHVLGDGARRPALERLAGRAGAVSFHNPDSDDLLALHIAAADMCVSVGEDGAGMLTLPECLSSGRPVIVAAGGPPGLRPIRHLVTGFAIEHDILSWIRFLQRDCPSRNTLRMMGMAASATPIEHVDRTAASYLTVIDRVRRPGARSLAVV
jgi:glycosyltransferase involved in cell wall biosynthesis